MLDLVSLIGDCIFDHDPYEYYDEFGDRDNGYAYVQSCIDNKDCGCLKQVLNDILHDEDEDPFNRLFAMYGIDGIEDIEDGKESD